MTPKKLSLSWTEAYRALASKLRGDGCSLAPDGWWKHCCDMHDVMYRTGRDDAGSEVTRREADLALRLCMECSAGTLILHWVYWAGVRLFGARAWKGSKSR